MEFMFWLVFTLGVTSFIIVSYHAVRWLDHKQKMWLLQEEAAKKQLRMLNLRKTNDLQPLFR